jgi:methylenetetrahydrofolate reductase (NADPH)
VTWGAGGSTALASLELAALCYRALGLTTCLHLTCTNSTRQVIDETLDRAREVGVRNVLALRGDAPRGAEYGLWVDEQAAESGEEEGEEADAVPFKWAADLVRYIRRRHGDWFCIGVAAYPEGHAEGSSSELCARSVDTDLPHLLDKVRAGADFIMTQLFFDAATFASFRAALRGADTEGILEKVPLIPGLLPVQSYQSVRRVTTLAHATLPKSVFARLDAVRADDGEVKRVGVDILAELVAELRRDGVRGFHFYTLNLEKAVTQIVERGGLVRSQEERRPAPPIIVTPAQAAAERPPAAATLPGGREMAADGEAGALGNEATWDDFPNWRFGDARSPAFGEIDGYGPSLRLPAITARRLWGTPLTPEDIGAVFRKHIAGEIAAMPWSEEGVTPETGAIARELLAMNARGWWTVASQPAVDGKESGDEVFGWGPRGGFVFQKVGGGPILRLATLIYVQAFVEFWLPTADWKSLREKLDKHPEVTYFAGNGNGQFEASDDAAVTPVTWGSFPGKE